MTERITGHGNPVLKLIRKLGRDAGTRRETGLMLCDGTKLLAEALDSGLTPVHAIIRTGCEIPPGLPSPTRVIETTDAIFSGLSPLDSPRSVLFTVPLPDTSLCPSDGKPRYIVLDRVQDPGNVGSVIRTAYAMGVDAVILAGGCAELSNPKTVRASMGTLFRQRVMQGPGDEILRFLHEQNVRVYTTGMNGLALTSWEPPDGGCAVLIGSEGRGLSDFWLGQGFQMLTIPMTGQCESLGAAVAAAIVIWGMRREC